jgi:hypothetical protein
VPPSPSCSGWSIAPPRHKGGPDYADREHVHRSVAGFALALPGRL